jgi:hypothetical protein
LEEEDEEAAAKEKRRDPGSEGAVGEANKERERQVLEAMELARSLPLLLVSNTASSQER